MIAVDKADGDGALRAKAALSDLRSAFRYLPRKRPSWEVQALAVSGLTGQGLDALLDVIEEHRALIEKNGDLAAIRAEQQRSWMWTLIGERLDRAFRGSPDVAALLARVEADVLAGRVTPPDATDALFAAFRGGKM